MVTALLCLFLTVEPITPSQLHDALQVPPRGATADTLAERIRAAFPPGTDLRTGARPMVDGSMVAFIVEADASFSRPPRVTGMINHGRGYDLVPVGETGLWVRVELIPTDTKFAYAYTVGDRSFGQSIVEMPKWSYPPESQEQPGRAYGKVVPLKFRSAIFHNNRTGAIYVPAARYGTMILAGWLLFSAIDQEHGSEWVALHDAALALVIFVVALTPGHPPPTAERVAA